MSYSENGGTQFTMPVAPYGGGYGNDGFGFGGNGAWWLIILLLFANNGWGNGFGFGGGFGGCMMPWMLNNTTNNDVQRGFDQAVLGRLAVFVNQRDTHISILQILMWGYFVYFSPFTSTTLSGSQVMSFHTPATT